MSLIINKSRKIKSNKNNKKIKIFKTIKILETFFQNKTQKNYSLYQNRSKSKSKLHTTKQYALTYQKLLS